MGARQGARTRRARHVGHDVAGVPRPRTPRPPRVEPASVRRGLGPRARALGRARPSLAGPRGLACVPGLVPCVRRAGRGPVAPVRRRRDGPGRLGRHPLQLRGRCGAGRTRLACTPDRQLAHTQRPDPTRAWRPALQPLPSRRTHRVGAASLGPRSCRCRVHRDGGGTVLSPTTCVSSATTAPMPGSSSNRRCPTTMVAVC